MCRSEVNIETLHLVSMMVNLDCIRTLEPLMRILVPVRVWPLLLLGVCLRSEHSIVARLNLNNMIVPCCQTRIIRNILAFNLNCLLVSD